MSWKKMIIGEQMPDKDDPKYQERYKEEVNAGRKFAKMTKIDKAAVGIQGFANRHTKAFLIIVFGFIFLSFGSNLYRMAKVWSQQDDRKSATEMQEEAVRTRHRRMNKAISSAHCMPPSINRDFQDNINVNKENNGYSDTKED